MITFKRTFKRSWTCGVWSHRLTNTLGPIQTGLMDFLRSSLTDGGSGGRGRDFWGQHPVTLGVLKSLLTINLVCFITHPKLSSTRTLSQNGSPTLDFTKIFLLNAGKLRKFACNIFSFSCIMSFIFNSTSSLNYHELWTAASAI